MDTSFNKSTNTYPTTDNNMCMKTNKKRSLEMNDLEPSRDVLVRRRGDHYGRIVRSVQALCPLHRAAPLLPRPEGAE